MDSDDTMPVLHAEEPEKPGKKRKLDASASDIAPTPVKQQKRSTPKEVAKLKATPQAPKKRGTGPSPKSTPNRKGESPAPIKLYQNASQVQCLLCEESVGSFPAAQRRHVWRAHMKRRPVIFCPRCDFSHEHDLGEVQAHMIEKHPGKSVSDIIDRRDKYGAKVREYLSQCFSNETPKKKRNRTPATPSSSSKKKPSSANTSRSESNAGQARPEFSTCKICSEEVKSQGTYKKRHAYKSHLNSPEWVRCNICDTGFRTIDSSNLTKHVKSAHDHEDPATVLTDNRNKYKEELMRTVRACFGA